MLPALAVCQVYPDSYVLDALDATDAYLMVPQEKLREVSLVWVMKLT